MSFVNMKQKDGTGTLKMDVLFLFGFISLVISAFISLIIYFFIYFFIIYFIHRYEYLKDGFIIFIWIYFIGIMAFFITIWSVSADGSKSFLMTHFSLAMVCIFLISIAFSLVVTLSMIWCRQRCGSFVLTSDEEAERVVITRHSSRSDITDAFDTLDRPKSIYRHPSSLSGTQLFQLSSPLEESICNIYNVPNFYSMCNLALYLYINVM